MGSPEKQPPLPDFIFHKLPPDHVMTTSPDRCSIVTTKLQISGGSLVGNVLTARKGVKTTTVSNRRSVFLSVLDFINSGSRAVAVDKLAACERRRFLTYLRQ